MASFFYGAKENDMDVNSNHLSHYLGRIYTFLINDAKSEVFPSLTMSMEDILVNIAKDANFLKNGRFDDDCKSLAAQITAVLEKNKHVFTLTYGFQNDECGKKVMAYKKQPVPEFMKPLGLKQLRKPHSPNTTQATLNTTQSVDSSSSVMSSFKVNALNSTLKFVKNDAQLVLQYPDMSTEQAEFVKQMITDCMIVKDGTDTGPGSKGMCDPLAEALRIFSLKYKFKLNSAVPMHYDMKRLFFEKIPKSKMTEENDIETISISSDDSENSDPSPTQSSSYDIDKNFAKKTILLIKKFLSNEAEETLVFPNLTVEEHRFVIWWRRFLKEADTTLLDGEVEEAMRVIREKIQIGPGQIRVRTRVTKISQTHRNVSLKKRNFMHPNPDDLSTVKSISNTKAETENIKENTNSPLNSLPTNVRTEYTEVNKSVQSNTNRSMPLKSISIAKVNAENVMEVNNNTQVNTPLINAQKENTEVNTNTPVNSVSAAKVNTDFSKESRVGEDFIAGRNANYVPNTEKSVKSKKLGKLIRAISELSEIFANNTMTELRNFISDDARDSLVFSNLKSDEIQFVLHFIDFANRMEFIRMFSVQGQMILDEIRSMLDRCSGRFRVVVSSKTFSPLNRSVTFKKTYKKSGAVKNPTPVYYASCAYMDFNDDALSISSSCSTNSNLNINMAEYEKEIDRFFHKTKTIHNNWIITSLTQLRDFIKDEYQASLLIPSITNSQMAFLTKWQKILGNSQVINCYLPDIQMLLVEIQRSALRNSHFTVSYRMTNVAKNQTRDITFFKKPSFPAKEAATKPVTVKEMTKPTENLPAKSVPKCDGNKAQVANNNPVPSVHPSIPKAASATSLPVQKAAIERMRPKSANIRSNLPQAKAKLIEALSQPVVSERGLKMMRSMGWDGGALGARGDGIVEPIMLPLDLARRAGLGSVKIPSKQAIIPVMTNLPVNITRVMLPHHPRKTEMKTGILQTVMKMIIDLQPATELNFPQNLTQKNWNFVRHIVNTFNMRAKTSLDPPSLSELCHKILEIMSQTEYIITACWGVTKKNILLVLSKGIYEPSDLDSKDWCSIVNIDRPKNIDEIVDKANRIDQANNRIGETLMVDGEAFRYYVLAQILEFCEKPNVTIDKGPSESTLTKDVLLKGTMVTKQMSYIKDVIARLNKRSRASTDSENEQALFNEIKGKLGEFVLDVEFPLLKRTDNTTVHKCIRLYKLFQQNTTKSLDKPTGPAVCDKILSNNKISETANIKKQTIPEKNAQDIMKNVASVQPAAKNASSISHTINKNTHDLCLESITKNAQNNPKNDTKHEKSKESNSWRHITIINDKMVENSTINSHNAPIDGQSAPMDGENAPMVGEDAPMVGEDAPRVGEDAPMVGQSPPTDGEDAPMDSRNAPTENMAEDCICCLPDDYDLDMQDMLSKFQENATNGQNVEYIFIEKETIEIEDSAKEISRHLTEKNKDKILNVDKKLDADILNLQNLTINEFKTLASAKEHLKCDKGVLKESSEQSLKETCLNVSEKQIVKPENDPNQSIKEDPNQVSTDKDMGKRMRCNAVTPDRLHKKCKYGDSAKKISITPINYPHSKITNKMAAEIQKSILDSIDYTEELPLLKCHGIQDGALVYSCHTEKSYNIIENVIRSLDLKFSIPQKREKVSHKMTVKINSFMNESAEAIFDRLETYNMSLNTKDWKVIKVEQSSDIVVIHVEIDDSSFKLIVKENYSLYAGTDEAKFSIVWD